MPKNELPIEFDKRTLSDYYISSIRKSSLTAKIGSIEKHRWAFSIFLLSAPVLFWVTDACIGYFWFYDDSFLNILVFNIPKPVLFSRILTSVAIFACLLLVVRLSSEKDLEHFLRKSVNWFSTTLKSVGTAVIAADRNGNVIFMNALAEELTGWSLGRAVGNPIRHVCGFFDVNTGGEFDYCNVLFQPGTRDNRVKLMDLKLQSADGTEKYIIGDAALIINDQNHNLGAVISFRDITDLIQKHETVNRLAKTIDQLPEAILITDDIGTIEYVNLSFERLIGLSRNKILHTSLDTLNRNDEFNIFVENTLLAIKAGNAEAKHVLRHQRDHRLHYLQVTISKIHHPQTQHSNYVAIYHDISKDIKLQEAKAKQKELERKRQVAELANEAKSQFLANITHELRTPLHGILSFAGFGIKKHRSAEDEKILHFFTMIEQSGQTLLVLINDLLDSAKLESGKMTFNFGAREINRDVDHVISEFTTILSEKNVTVNSHHSDSAMVVVYDSEKIKQVVRNLLSNAIKFTPKDGIIDVTVARYNDQIRVSVKDQGIGIPEEELESVFDKFVQSSKTDTKFGGTGLGLSICKEIIDAHKGHIWAENNPDRGAKFIFEIPYNRDEAQNEENLIRNSRSSERN